MEAAPASVPAGVCKLLGGRCPSLGAARDAVGKEKAERQKERKREGESGESRAGRADGRVAGARRRSRRKAAAAPSLARQPAGPRTGWARGAGTMCLRSLPAATQRLRRPGPAARVPQVSVCLRRVGVPLAIAECPKLPQHPQWGAEAGAGRVDLPAAKTFIMGWTPEGLGGDLRCRQFSEVHAQRGICLIYILEPVL